MVPDGSGQLIYRGRSGLKDERLHHSVIFTVRDLTKVIDGVRTVMLWEEEDYTAGELVETELAFFAQDKSGNVWHFGQSRGVRGREVRQGSGVDRGVAGAKAGITMKREPKADAPDYAQGFAPQADQLDRPGARARDGRRDLRPRRGLFRRPRHGGVRDRQARGVSAEVLAHGVGNIRVGRGGPGEDEHEVLVLEAADMLSAEELAEVRQQVLDIEARAYERSPNGYGTTPPSERRSD